MCVLYIYIIHIYYTYILYIYIYIIHIYIYIYYTYILYIYIIHIYYTYILYIYIYYTYILYIYIIHIYYTYILYIYLEFMALWPQRLTIHPVPCRPGNPATVKTQEVAHRRRRSSPGPLVVPGLWTAMGYGIWIWSMWLLLIGIWFVWFYQSPKWPDDGGRLHMIAWSPITSA